MCDRSDWNSASQSESQSSRQSIILICCCTDYYEGNFTLVNVFYPAFDRDRAFLFVMATYYLRLGHYFGTIYLTICTIKMR